MRATRTPLIAMFCWTAALWPNLGLSQTQLSLQDCVSGALKRNLGIVSGKNDVAEGQHKERDAQLDFLPRVDVDLRRTNSGDFGMGKAGDVQDVAQAFEEYQTTQDLGDLTGSIWDYVARELFSARSNDADYVDYTASVAASWQVYTAGRLTNTLKSERLATEVAKVKLTSTALQLVYDVSRSYYGGLAASQNAGISETAVREAERVLTQFKKSQELGAATHVDLLNAEALLQEEKARVIGARGSWEASLLALKALVSLPDGEAVELTDSLDVPEEEEALGLDFEKLVLEAQAQRPETYINSLGVEMARTGIDLIRSARRPNLSLVSSYSEAWNSDFGGDFVMSLWDVKAVMTMGIWGDSSMKAEMDEGQLRFGEDKEKDSRTDRSVTFSFMDGSSMRSVLAEAEHAFDEALQADSDFRRVLAAEVFASASKVRTSFYDVLAAEKHVAAAEAELQKSELELNLGAGTSSDLTEKASKLTGRRIALSTAKLNLNLSKAELNKALGRVPAYCCDILDSVVRSD